MSWLAYPTMAVHTVERRLTNRKPRYVVSRRSVHFGVTDALQSAARLRLAGCRMVYIAGTKRALLPGAAKVRR